jgi:formate hydrogenlyase transcriptional activator
MFFLDRYAKKLGKQVNCVSEELMHRLIEYSWPGNIREIQNVIERAVVLASASETMIRPELVPIFSARSATEVLDLTTALEPMSEGASFAGISKRASALGDVEKLHILEVLAQTNWVIEGERGAAAVLKLHPNTLRSRMKKLGIRRPVS